MESYLPEYCYSGRALTPQAIVVHYFSCAYTQPSDPFDLASCQTLMHDLNTTKDRRISYLKTPKDRASRFYASAHAMVGREGELLLTVPTNNQAYHAGKSDYKGRSNWNRFSYGIELIGDANSGFSDAQYQTCAKRCAALVRAYAMSVEWIVGHEEIAPGRKFDPGIATGNFNMLKLRTLINKLVETS